MAKTLTLSQIASHSSGKERHCVNCEFCSGKLICPYIKVCDAAYRRGFIKGYKYYRDMNRLKTK